MKTKRVASLLASLVLTALFMTSCIGTSHVSKTSGLSQDYLNMITKNAEVITVVKHDTPADVLFEEVYGILLDRGHRISKDDKERHYIATEGKDAGESTVQRMIINISENTNNSEMKIRTEWKAGTEAMMGASMFAGVRINQEWTTAKWEAGRPGIAFGESVAIASAIKNGIVSYK